jgi:multidrug efflux pump subunit AcrA (membrane-fusion protein)
MNPAPSSADLSPLASKHDLTTTGVSLQRFLPLAILALISGVGATALVARVGQVHRTGFLRAEQSIVYAPRAGRVVQIEARTGQIVRPEQTLLQLANDSLDHEIATKTRELTSAAAELEQCRAQAEVQMSLQLKDVDDDLLRTRLNSANFLRDHFTASIEEVTWGNLLRDSQTIRWLAATPDFLKRPERLFDTLPGDDLVTPNELRLGTVLRHEWARNASEVNKAQAELCDHHISELEKLKKTLPDMIRKAAGVDVAESKLALATEQLQTLNQLKQELTIRSQGYGIVGLHSKQVGDPVSAGEALVSIYDRERTYVEVDVSSYEVAQLAVGQTLRLNFAGQERLGRIESISPQARRDSGTSDSWISVRLRPAGKLWPEAPIGSAVTVDLK